jgi:hypothetical protein
MPKGAEILMLNAAREGKGRFDSVLEDAATETAAINPESENRSEIVATVATVAPAAFEATRLPGVVLGIAAILDTSSSPANRGPTKSAVPDDNSKHPQDGSQGPRDNHRSARAGPRHDHRGQGRPRSQS